MSEQSTMTNYKQVSRFLIATNVEEMHHRIEAGLRRKTDSNLSVKELDIPRVFPRKNGSFCIQYSLLLQSSANAQTKRLILCGAQLKSVAEASNLAANWGREVILCDDLNLVIPIFPYDPALSILGQLASGNTVPTILNNWLSTQLCVGEVGAEFDREVLGYRLEKRCTLSCSVRIHNKDTNKSRTVRFIAKAVPPRKVAKLANKLAYLQQHWHSTSETVELTIPKTYNLDHATGLYLMEYLPGQSMHDLAGRADFVPACLAAGKLLRKLHSFPPFPGNIRTREQELDSVQRWIALVSPLRDDWRESFNTIRGRLQGSAVDTDSHYKATCLHGDFYDKQVLYGADCASLIDFDNLGGGDPAVDVGNFMAHLDLRNLQHPNEVQLINRGKKAFKDSYGDGDEDFQNRINWWKCAALVRLAAIYALRPRWQHLPPHLLAIATGLCGGINKEQRKAEIQ